MSVPQKHWAFLLGVAVFVVLLARHWGALFDPPYWDSALGAFKQGVWLARHDLDVFALARQPTYVEGGPNVYPFSLYPLAVGALYHAGLAVRSVFCVMHLVSLVSAAAAAGAFFAMLRAPLGVRGAFACVVLLVATPLYQSLAAQTNMDMPLVACSLLSLYALVRARPRAAFGWAALALLVKPNAIVLIGANLAWILVRHRRELARHWPSLALQGSLALLFALEFFVLGRIARAPAYVEPFSGFVNLFGKRLWIIPEYGLGVAAFLLLLPWTFLRWRRGSVGEVELACVLFTLVFLGFYGQYTNTLPRYFSNSYPFLIGGFALLPLAGVWVWLRRAAACALLVFSLLNQNGRLYFEAQSPWQIAGDAREVLRTDGWILERTLEYQEDLELDRRVARRLVELGLDQRVCVANWVFQHALAFPELGFVDHPLRVSGHTLPLTFDENRVPFEALYDKVDGRQTKRPGAPATVFVLTPNVFSSPEVAPMALDRIVETVECGRFRAWIVERPGWEAR